MMQARWMVLQACIAGPVYFFCSDTLKGEGLAPAIVSLFCAFLVTGLLISLIDWFRARSVRVRHKTQGEASGLTRISGRSGDSPQHPGRIGISKNVRKLR